MDSSGFKLVTVPCLTLEIKSKEFCNNPLLPHINPKVTSALGRRQNDRGHRLLDQPYLSACLSDRKRKRGREGGRLGVSKQSGGKQEDP